MNVAKLGIAAGICLAASFVQGAPAQAQGADYYNGKTVTYIVATAPGGNYDTYGRLPPRNLGVY